MWPNHITQRPRLGFAQVRDLIQAERVLIILRNALPDTRYGIAMRIHDQSFIISFMNC